MVVTHRLPLEEAPTGYKLFNDKEVGARRVMLRVECMLAPAPAIERQAVN